MTTLVDVHREFLPELDMCACHYCYRHGLALTRLTNPGISTGVEEEVEYWSAMSDRLQVLAAGKHRRVSMRARARWERLRRPPARFCRTAEDFAAAAVAGAPAIATWPMYGQGADSPGIGVGGALQMYGLTRPTREAEELVFEIEAAAEVGELTLW